MLAFNRETGLPETWNVTLEQMRQAESRIPLLDPEHLPEDIRGELAVPFQTSLEKWGTVPRFLRMLGHSPALVETWMVMDARVRQTARRDDPEYVQMQQLVIVKTSLLNHSINCTGHNTVLGRAVGLTWEQLDLLIGDDWQSSDLLSEKAKAAINWAEKVTLHQAKDDDAAFAAMQAHFSTRQIVELTFLCGMWNASGRFDALHLMVEPPGERIAFQ
jgi:alkylhydroperoxidase family enzyme